LLTTLKKRIPKMATTPAVVRFGYKNVHVENYKEEPAKEARESLETKTREGERDKRV